MNENELAACCLSPEVCNSNLEKVQTGACKWDPIACQPALLTCARGAQQQAWFASAVAGSSGIARRKSRPKDPVAGMAQGNAKQRGWALVPRSLGTQGPTFRHDAARPRRGGVGQARFIPVASKPRISDAHSLRILRTVFVDDKHLAGYQLHTV